MKVGILTMNYAQNYGGILQTYAMSQFLKELGHDVQIINYRNSGKNSFISVIAKVCARLHKKGDSITTPPRHSLSKKYLQNFIDFKDRELTYTHSVDEYSIVDCCKNLDAIIIGSDQIWNDVYTNKLIYYFDWMFSGKKISYAACTILQDAPFFRRKKITKLLASFDTITVRDRHTGNYVKSMTGLTPMQVVDPSCLHDYHALISDNPIGKPYILTYILSGDIQGGNKSAMETIKQNIGNLTVVSVCIPSVSTISKEISDIFMEEATPAEWVNLFYHASFVYTDSFHGIMFSMKFHKPFIAYMKEGGRKSRLQDLIETYSLANIVSNVEQIRNLSFSNLINYQQVDSILERNVRASKIILQQAISLD